MFNSLEKVKKLLRKTTVQNKTREEIQAEVLESHTREAMIRAEEIDNASL